MNAIADEGDEQAAYARDLAPSRFGTHRMIAARVGRGQRVLDVGAGEGALAVALAGQNNRVVCLEIDPARADAARKRGLEVVVHNIEQDGVASLGKFDVIVCADVLEHLFDPHVALLKLKEALNPGGRLVTSIPNIAFYAIRFRLMAGQFNYTDEGILDRTHLRFFTGKTARRLLEDAGFRVPWQSITLAPPTRALPGLSRLWERILERRRAGNAIHRALSVFSGFFASQFVFEAVPGP